MDTTKTKDTDRTDLTGTTDEATETPEDKETGQAAVAETPGAAQGTGKAGTEPSDTDGTDVDGEPEDEQATAPVRSSVIATGAAAVVGAALGLASLTGTWVGRLAAEREQLIGQIKTSTSGGQAQPQDQIAALYGNPWHATALFNGLFALAALIVAGAVLLRPVAAAAAADSPRATWIRAVAWAGVVLGVLGLLVSGALYFDVFGMPSASAPTG
ncbi:hypothetical protein [Streptomyces sp. 8N706]|uniref:hypothetical protein n=1 Tax=Streptomyces sp. 8N706 TaxID=3457416 RepID=UPI003FD19282